MKPDEERLQLIKVKEDLIRIIGLDSKELRSLCESRDHARDERSKSESRLALAESIIKAKDEALDHALDFVGIVGHGNSWAARESIHKARSLNLDSDNK